MTSKSRISQLPSFHLYRQMLFIDPLENTEAYKYAFASAIREHLHILKEQTRLKELLLKESNEENEQLTIETRDMIYYLELVIEFVLGDILKYHVKKDVEQSKNWGFPSKALSHNFPVLLLGPAIDEATISRLSTSTLLASAQHGQPAHSYVVDREEHLGKVFYTEFRNAFEISFSHLNVEDGKRTMMLSSFVAAFLKNSINEYPQVFNRRSYLEDRINYVVEKLENYSQVPTQEVPIEQLYRTFAKLTKAHLEMVDLRFEPNDRKDVLKKLREQGNNLMLNYAYAQAIKVYTEAILMCVGETTSQVPQLLVNRAIAFIGLSCFPEAVQDLNLALNSDISSVPAWIQLGYAHLYLGNSLVALKCYSMALQCCSGKCFRVLPYNFPDEESYLEEYQKQKRRSTLPQLVEQLLKAIKLTETRARQQRVSLGDINAVLDDIKEAAKLISEEAAEEDLYLFVYPPGSSTPEAFRDLATRVSGSRPGILRHEVSQGEPDASLSLAQASRAPVSVIGVEAQPISRRWNSERALETPSIPTSAQTLSQPDQTLNPAPTPNDPNRERPDAPARVIRDLVRDLLPGASEHIGNILGSFGAVGGPGVSVEGFGQGRTETRDDRQANRDRDSLSDDMPDLD